MPSRYNRNFSNFGSSLTISNVDELQAEKITAASIDVGGIQIEDTVTSAGDIDLNNNNILNANVINAQTVSATEYDYITSTNHNVVDNEINIAFGSANVVKLTADATGLQVDKNINAPTMSLAGVDLQTTIDGKANVT